MEEEAYYSDQSTYDEEDYYMDECLTESEEDYDPEANIEEIDPKPPDYDSDQSDDTMSSTWSKPYKTPYTSNSVIYVDLYHQSAPKIKLYAFSGKRSYLEWEENMDDWFYYNHVKEEKRLAYAIEQLSGEVYKWWVKEKAERRKYKEPTITTWRMLKKLLRQRYAPKRRTEASPSKARSDREREVAGQNKAYHVLVKGSSNQNRKVGDQRSKQQALQLQTELRKKKLEDDLKKCVQEAIEAVKTIRKKERVTNQSVSTKANKERSQSLENQKPEQDFPLPSHKEPMPLELESDKAKENTQGENQLSVPTTSQTSLDQHEATIFSKLLQGTQVSLAYESIQYLNNIIFTRGFKLSVMNVETSSIIHLILPLSAKENSGSINECKSFKRTAATRSLPLNQTEQPTHLVQEPFLLPSPYDNPRKHCKEIDLVGNGTNLFVTVSIEEEKRFGLENVKEFRVSSSDFDKMISSFETLTLETLSNQMGFTVNDFLKHTSRVSLSCNIFELLKTDTHVALFSTWSELDFWLRNSLIESFKLRDHALEVNHSIKDLESFGNKSMFNHLERLFFDPYHTFDVFSLVFVKEQERQVKDSRARTIQVLSNQVDYGPRQHLSYHSKFWNWKYPRKDTLHRGSRTEFKRTRREDDQRFKPPDLAQIKHLNPCFFYLIKEEPPDATSKPKTRLHTFGGNFLFLVHFMLTNLLFFHADYSDLRTNPFQVGGDDMIMDQQLEPEQGKHMELKPEQAQQVLEMTSGPITRAKAKQLKQAVGTLLRQAESNLSPMANPTTLVLILAD